MRCGASSADDTPLGRVKREPWSLVDPEELDDTLERRWDREHDDGRVIEPGLIERHHMELRLGVGPVRWTPRHAWPFGALRAAR